MNAETITTAPRTLDEKQKSPRMVIPARALRYAAIALGVVVLVLVVVQQTLTPIPSAAVADVETLSVPENAADVQQRLQAELRQKQIEEAAKAKAALLTASVSATGLSVPATRIGVGGRRAVTGAEDGGGPETRDRRIDQFKEMMAQKEFTSLFAGSSVPPTANDRRGSTPRGPMPARGARSVLAANGDDDDAPGQDASLDDITQSVLKAMGPAVLAPPALQPVPQTPTPPQGVAQPPTAAPGVPGAKGQASRPAGSLVAYEGTVLDGVTVNRIEGSQAGPVKVLLTTPLYSFDRKLMAPAGAAILGRSTPVQGMDDDRLAVGFHRMILNDGTDVSLDNFTGLSLRGDAGLTGKVNRHMLSTFGAAGMIGLISGLGQWVGSGGGHDGNNNVVIGNMGDQTSQAAMQAFSHFLNRRPTVSVKEGTAVKVYLTSDLFLPEYREAP